jgi:hypothetical protein
MRSVSQGRKAKQRQAAATDGGQQVIAGIGVNRPRLETAVPAQGTYGHLVAAWALEHLQLALMPWQVHVLNGMLAQGADADSKAGQLHHRSSLVLVARQQGKTTLLKALAGWWLTGMAKLRGRPQTVLTTAHALDLAYQLFQELAPVLEKKHGAVVKWSYGRNELTLPDGSTWLVRAATPSAGHGRSVDLVLADECWSISEEAIEQGLMPSQRARWSPLLAMFSTAGTEHSKLLLRHREAGMRAIDTGSGSMYFAEFSPPPNADLADPATWSWSNPALGHTLELDTLRAEAVGPNRSAFLRGSLNLWIASDDSWLPAGLWEQLTDPRPAPAPLVLAMDSSQDDSRYCGILAGVHDDGKVHLSVAFQVNTEAEAWTAVRLLLGPTTVLAVTPTLDIHVPPEVKRRTTVGYGELLKWTQLVRGMLAEGRVVHSGDVALADHMARAVAARTQAGPVLSSQRSPGPIELARCAVWAAALASKARWTSKPAMGARRPR